MAAFVGVFDGHDGDLASDYCRKGLVPHIISELSGQSVAAVQVSRWSIAADRACAPLDFETSESSNPSTSEMSHQYISAFHRAHDRFCNNLEPPSFDEVSQPGPLKVAPAASYNPMQWMATPIPSQRGGTTACTMSVVSSLGIC